ncbi:hypothetical protein GCM10028793_10490 [Nocardiopsis oceani]
MLPFPGRAPDLLHGPPSSDKISTKVHISQADIRIGILHLVVVIARVSEELRVGILTELPPNVPSTQDYRTEPDGLGRATLSIAAVTVHDDLER